MEVLHMEVLHFKALGLASTRSGVGLFEGLDRIDSVRGSLTNIVEAGYKCIPPLSVLTGALTLTTWPILVGWGNRGGADLGVFVC